jgi:hypothetical protein
MPHREKGNTGEKRTNITRNNILILFQNDEKCQITDLRTINPK